MDHTKHRNDQHGADWKINQESPSPAEESRDQATDNRARRNDDANAGSPERIRFRALRPRKGVVDYRKGRRQQGARADALQRSRQV